jgi:hypothetical protein
MSAQVPEPTVVSLLLVAMIAGMGLRSNWMES